MENKPHTLTLSASEADAAIEKLEDILSLAEDLQVNADSLIRQITETETVSLWRVDAIQENLNQLREVTK